MDREKADPIQNEEVGMDYQSMHDLEFEGGIQLQAGDYVGEGKLTGSKIKYPGE